MRPGRFAAVVGVMLSLAGRASEAQSAVLFGTVLRDSAGHPLADATVELSRLHRTARTDSLGNFKLDRLPAGTLALSVRHLGFNRLDDIFDIDDGATYTTRYVLEAWPVVLERVDVKAAETKWISSELNEFEDRRRHNVGGYFITDSTLSTTETHSMQSLLLGKIPHLSRAGRYVSAGRSGYNKCSPVLFIDGAVAYMPGGFGAPPELDLEDPNRYSGVEFYPGGATVPERFNITAKDCGVLILWSRERITKP
jgi:hypothetical protein